MVIRAMTSARAAGKHWPRKYQIEYPAWGLDDSSYDHKHLTYGLHLGRGQRRRRLRPVGLRRRLRPRLRPHPHGRRLLWRVDGSRAGRRRSRTAPPPCARTTARTGAAAPISSTSPMATATARRTTASSATRMRTPEGRASCTGPAAATPTWVTILRYVQITKASTCARGRTAAAHYHDLASIHSSQRECGSMRRFGFPMNAGCNGGIK